ncbi:MAG: AI-2E family transporter [Cyclonatronaceae bacterium]
MIRNLKNDPSTRTVRSRVFYSIAVLVGGAAIIYLAFALSTLILPVLLGIVAAYICQPLLSLMYRNGISRGTSTLILFGGFLIILLLLGRYVIGLVPGEFEQLELRASIQQNINDRYQNYMGLDDDLHNGNVVHDFAGPELDPLMDTFNEWLFLSESNQEKLREWAALQDEQTRSRIHHLLDRMTALRLYADPEILLSERISFIEEDPGEEENGEDGSLLLSVLNILSLWLVMPVMFLFFLVDNGQMRRGIVAIVPNTYFEMVLTVMENVDQAIGNYLRGTLIETLLMTATIWILLAVIGFDLGISFILGLISGIANAIPIFGMFIGVGICIIYALMLNDVTALIPWVTVENLILWVVAVHLLAQGIDNAVFKPFVLGKAVALHPIVVFLGAIVGSILFGFAGLLFAIPAIVILKEITGTFYHQLKAYFLIY